MSHPREECGVFGAWLPDQQLAPLLYLGLYALQHRGQEGAGMVLSSGRGFSDRRRAGLVPQAFSRRWLQETPGDRGIGHVRYSTSGDNAQENLQPLVCGRDNGHPLALCHNGTLLNSKKLRQELVGRGRTLRGNADSELILALLAEQIEAGAPSLQEAMSEVAPLLRGAWSLLALSPKELLAARDEHGFRPLSVARMGLGYVFSSETCALDIIGARDIEEVRPGESLQVSPEGIRSVQIAPERRRSCIFEDIYFSRPDSLLGGRRVYESRRAMGEILAQEAPAKADVVIGVPDSGTPAAAGYAMRSGLPRDEGLVKNRYVARTFIQPGQDLRKLGVQIKFNPLPEVVAGKRLVLVDDSLVRGNTMRSLIQLLRGGGAREIHLRISSPPITHPCHYGIDMPDRDHLLAASNSAEEIRQEVGADSLAFLSLEGVYRATGADPNSSCDACFTGRYPAS